MGMESLVGPIVVTELENADMAIGRGTGKETTTLMRGPRYHVDGSGVEGEVEDLSPCAATDGGSGILGLFAPDQNLAVVGGGCQDGAELGVRLYVKWIMVSPLATRSR